MEDISDNSLNEDQIVKERHGCVTAWLILMIISSAGVAVLYFFFNEFILAAMPNASVSNLYILGIIGILNVIFAVMIMQWKKMGFYGFIGTTVITFGINMMMGLGIAQSVSGILGVAILYAILQIKQNKRSAWENLEG